MQQLGLLLAAALEPAFKAGQLVDVVRDALIKEAIQGFVIYHDIALAGLGFQLIELGQQLLIGLVERRAAMPLTAHQCLANKQLARGDRVNRAKVHLAPRHDDQPVQRHLLKGHHLAALFLPVRLAVAGLDQVPGQRLNPGRINLGGQTAIEATGFGQLGHHDPGRLLLGQPGGWVQQKAALARAQIIALFGLVAQVAEQAGQQSLVYRLVRGRLAVFFQPQVVAGQTDLAMGFAPLAQAQVIEKVTPTPAAQLALRQCLALGLKAIPQIEEGDKIGALLIPLGMRLIRRLLLLQRPLARVLHGQCRGNHGNLGQ